MRFVYFHFKIFPLYVFSKLNIDDVFHIQWTKVVYTARKQNSFINYGRKWPRSDVCKYKRWTYPHDLYFQAIGTILANNGDYLQALENTGARCVRKKKKIINTI